MEVVEHVEEVFIYIREGKGENLSLEGGINRMRLLKEANRIKSL
jgi:hypothetical protein